MPEPSKKNQSPQEEPEEAGGAKPAEPVSFPWLMFFVAALFDAIAFFFPPAELVFGFIIGFWQKKYVPKTDPILTFIIAKIADAVFLGMLPSNIAIVVFAYAKKKLEEKKETLLKLSQSRLGKYAVNRLSKQSA